MIDGSKAERALEAVGRRESFGFNYDPSHFGYQGVDYVGFIRRFADRIYHAHMKDVWWGKVNIPCDAQTFAINRQRARDYLNTRDRLYCFDGFAGWDAMNALVHGIVARYHGSISAEHGIGRLKRDLLPDAKGPVAIDMMRSIKLALDPNGILNPGKMLRL